MRTRTGWGVYCLVLLFWGGSAFAVDPRDTRLLTTPAISATQIAFSYDGGLWIAGRDGSGARRLTTHEGIETNPVFSPDGKWLAFSAQYDGNVDVYLVPVEGGVPRRLTWHPGADFVLGFTHDGGAVLFRSQRASFTGTQAQLFTVSIDGGFPTRLPVPHADKASYSPRGDRLAYTPLGERFTQWKNYRGGTVSRIWLYGLADHQVVQIPQPAGRCNDTDPLWVADNMVCFRSDRLGEFNLFAYDVADKSLRQLTQHADFPVLSVAAGGGALIYEQGGRLHLYDLAAGTSQPLVVAVPSELLETRPRYVKGPQYIRDAQLSPSGARAALEYRGEIVTVPAAKGDPRNETNSPGTHERSPAWSPDGKNLAYFSDESGEYELHVRRLGTQSAVKKYRLSGSGFYSDPKWSPDSKRLCYSDNSLSLSWLDLESGVSKKFAQQPVYGPRPVVSNEFNWSPDSKWIVYTLNSPNLIRTAHLYSLEQDKSFPLRAGLGDVSDPVFDAGGKYLYFLASTDSGPVRDWFAMSNADMRTTSQLYLAVLRSDLPSPLARESDEEKSAPEAAAPATAAPVEQKEGKPAAAPGAFTIDFEGLEQRIVALNLPARDYSELRAGNSGEIYFLERSTESPENPLAALKQYSLSRRSADVIVEQVSGFSLSADNRKILYVSGGRIGIIPAAGRAAPGQGALNIDAIEVAIDPRAEWSQMFHEAWRINRDYFYATNFHGADWPRMREKYAQFLPHLATRGDLNRVIQWMCSELSVGHHFVTGGDRLNTPKSIGVGLLGADYELAENRYRFRKVFGGLNWSPDLRAPLTEPGVGVKAGEYLLEVNGRDLRPPTDIDSQFQNAVGKQVRLRVGPSPDGKDSREVTVVPIGDESALRNRDWVEGNIRKVHEATGNRVAYVYVPNTTNLGHAYFKRYFYPQASMDAIIVDERFNGGGQVADYYIDLLRRPLIAHWATRYGSDFKTPTASIQGPKVMLIDETAGSGGDLLPWMFRKFQLGTLVGKRTWGGLVGILGFPLLIDGGMVTAPDLAIWTEEGWVVENEGVPPDIEVEQWPAEVLAGRDPQLEKAIEVALEELKKNPPQRPQRPAYPVRVRPGAN